jgi:hypothetical protein
MSTEFVTFARVERAFQEGAEDGWLDIAPILQRGGFKEVELSAVYGESGVIREQAAVEAEKFCSENDGNALAGAGVEFPEELPQEFFEASAIVRDRLQQFGECVVWDQADIFGEHAEEATGEEVGDDARPVTIRFERFGEFGKVAGNGESDISGMAGWIERNGISPNVLQALADFGVGELFETDAEGARIGEGKIGFPHLGEIGEDLKAMADIGDEQERGIWLGSGK